MSRCLRIFCLALVFVAGAWSLVSQDKNSRQAEPDPERVHVVQLGRGITPPEPLPLTQPPVPEGCHRKVSGKVKVAAIVDAEGRPRNLFLIEALANNLDMLALLLVDHERFKPAMRNGVPVAVGVTLEQELNSCILDKAGADGKKGHFLHLRSMAIPKLAPLRDVPEEIAFGPTVEENTLKNFAALKPVPGEHREPRPDVIQPKLIKSVEANFSDEARKKKISGTNVLSLVVDSNGMPRQLEVVRRLGAGLDEMAMMAVQAYRFQPATKNGLPIAVPISVEVRFRYY